MASRIMLPLLALCLLATSGCCCWPRQSSVPASATMTARAQEKRTIQPRLLSAYGSINPVFLEVEPLETFF